MNRRRLGQQAEEMAVCFLEARNFRVLERNYYSPYGEIDIIAQDGEVVVFIEVKSCRTATFGDPAGWINRRKQRRLVLTAQVYLQKTGFDNLCRFDAVVVNYLNTEPKITHYKDAFLPEYE
ncbi:YraN family protein [candidate division KSB1 bacterium]|nr:YraN family protein [candidate division KSB1 bacterium]